MKKVKYDRKYLGVTITAQNYKEISIREGRDGINFHEKHLRAYLQGKETFKHKFRRDEKGRVVTDQWGHPIWNEFRVQQELSQIPDSGDARGEA